MPVPHVQISTKKPIKCFEDTIKYHMRHCQNQLMGFMDITNMHKHVVYPKYIME